MELSYRNLSASRMETGQLQTFSFHPRIRVELRNHIPVYLLRLPCSSLVGAAPSVVVTMSMAASWVVWAACPLALVSGDSEWLAAVKVLGTCTACCHCSASWLHRTPRWQRPFLLPGHCSCLLHSTTSAGSQQPGVQTLGIPPPLCHDPIVCAPLT